MGEASSLAEWVSEVAQSCPTLCDPMDCSLPGSSVHGILQRRILERVAISFPRRSSRPRDWTQVSCTAGRFFTNWAMREAQLFFWLYHMACRILVPWPGIKPLSPSLAVWSLNHWTTSKVPSHSYSSVYDIVTVGLFEALTCFLHLYKVVSQVPSCWKHMELMILCASYFGYIVSFYVPINQL